RSTIEPPVSQDRRPSRRTCTCAASGSSPTCSSQYSVSQARTSSSSFARQRLRPSTSSSYLATGGDVLRSMRFLQHRLGSCEARNRHAERRAADVVQAEPVAELDGARVA